MMSDGRRAGVNVMALVRAAVAAGCVLVLGSALAHAAAPKAEDAPEGGDITWRLSGPGGGGWIQAIAYDPHEPDLLYVGCDVGGFYFSSDGGRSYELRNNGLRNYFVECIAIHPRDSRIILLGTEGGIFRTTDRGRTWQWVRSGFPEVQRYSFSAPIGAVCFDPQDPRVAYAGTGRPRWGNDGQGAVYRSDDGGLSWRNISDGQLPSDAIVSDIELKPGEARVILIATQRGVFRSDDAGSTWRSCSDGLPHLYVEELAFAPSSPDIVYASLRTTARDQAPWNGGVFRSDDAGRTWRPANGDGMPMRVGRSGQPAPMTSNIKEIVVDPRDADVVYAGSTAWVTDGVYKTSDAGRTWERVGTRVTQNMDYGWITQWGTAVTCMAVSPADPDRVVFGTSGHLFATEDAGASWQQRYCRELPDGRFTGSGLEVTCLNKVLPDPVRPGRLYFCYMDIGLLISDDDGRTFRRSSEGMVHDGNCFTVAVDPQAPSTLWAGTGQWGSNVGDVCRSDDGGESWQVVGDPDTGLPNGQVRDLIIDLGSPVAERRLVVTSNGHGVYESRDGGASWRAINGDLSVDAVRSPRGLLLDPVDPDHMILALGGTPDNGAGIYETRDGGATWRRLNDEPTFASITSLAAAPGDFSTLYVGARAHFDHATQRGYLGGLFKSTDGGRSWRQMLDYHFVSAVAVSPADPQVIYVGTNDHPYHDEYAASGILKSTDGGLTWQRENTGLSILNFKSLSVSPHDASVIYAGTTGNSVFIGKNRDSHLFSPL